EFKALDLAQFIDGKYYELTGIQKQIVDDFIRSERSCRVDLRRWGAKFEANSPRPYFEGHERDDVVEHRNEFIRYFLPHKDFYYTISNGDAPMWNIPAQNPYRILICHDESTFRSGKVSPKRWFFKENTPFFRKDMDMERSRLQNLKCWRLNTVLRLSVIIQVLSNKNKD
ncbi:unnamed protein product, partial [Didymodactylos carnosus]